MRLATGGGKLVVGIPFPEEGENVVLVDLPGGGSLVVNRTTGFRFARFRLRTLLVAVTVVAVGLSILGAYLRHQQRIARIESLASSACFAFLCVWKASYTNRDGENRRVLIYDSGMRRHPGVVPHCLIFTDRALRVIRWQRCDANFESARIEQRDEGPVLAVDVYFDDASATYRYSLDDGRLGEEPQLQWRWRPPYNWLLDRGSDGIAVDAAVAIDR